MSLDELLRQAYTLKDWSLVKQAYKQLSGKELANESFTATQESSPVFNSTNTFVDDAPPTEADPKMLARVAAKNNNARERFQPVTVKCSRCGEVETVSPALVKSIGDYVCNGCVASRG